jgi:hypothetical protein
MDSPLQDWVMMIMMRVYFSFWILGKHEFDNKYLYGKCGRHWINYVLSAMEISPNPLFLNFLGAYRHAKHVTFPEVFFASTQGFAEIMK